MCLERKFRLPAQCPGLIAAYKYLEETANGSTVNGTVLGLFVYLDKEIQQNISLFLVGIYSVSFDSLLVPDLLGPRATRLVIFDAWVFFTVIREGAVFRWMYFSWFAGQRVYREKKYRNFYYAE